MFRHRFLLVSLLCLCAVPGLAFGDPSKAPEQVTITVVPATTSFYAGDILLIKVVLKNNGKTPVALAQPFSADWRGVRAEVCPPGETAFTRADMFGEGSSCGLTDKKSEVPAGTSIVCYERLFWNRAPRLGPIFPTAGKWQIRISVTIGEAVITSEPVELSVAAPPERIKKALSEEIRSIGLALNGQQPTEEEVKLMLNARDPLGGSNAAKIITQARVLRELLEAGSGKVRQFALAAAQKHRADLSPVTQEEFDLLTAEVLCRLKEYDQAKKIVDAITESSEKRNFLLASIRRRD